MAPYLKRWKVPERTREIILNSIRAHHDRNEPVRSKIAEVVKNAECFKFVTLEGSLMYLHELGRRGIPYEKAKEYVLKKMQAKRRLITLPDCKKEADKNIREIRRVFGTN